MKTIVIYVDGTLGDHFPAVALAQALAARGYRVRMAINKAMHPYAERAGLEAIALTDVERGPEEARQNAWAWNHWRDPDSARPANFTGLSPDDLVTQASELIEICRGADLLLATSIRVLGFAVHHATNIPWITISVNPSTFVQPVSAQEQSIFKQSRQREYDHTKELYSYMFAQLKIDKPLPDFRDGVWFARHILLGSSPYFSQINVEQFQPHSSIDLTGFWLYQDPDWKNWQPDATLARFCERQPIALSFSSQPLEERRQTLAKHVHAAQRLGRPLLIQRGWADFSEEDLPADANRDHILFADFIPHDWLFSHVACAIQHGGIGSIARALRQGCPLIIEPYGNDQFYNADRVTELGAGAALSPFRSTVSDLTQVLGGYVLTPQCRERVRAIGAEMAKEDGVTTACEMIDRYLGRLDAQGHLPSIYDRYTPPLTPRKRQTTIEPGVTSANAPSPVSPVKNENAPAKPILILFYNQMWELPFNFDWLDLPADCRWTTDRRLFAQADAVVFHIPTLEDIHNLVKPPGQIWVAWSQECNLYYPQLGDSNFMRQFDLTMTYERHSDIPHPYYGVDMLKAFQSPPHPKTQTTPAALFISSHVNLSGRLEFVTELGRHMDIHSYGRQLNNRSLANDRGSQDKLATIASYKFTLALENAIAPDYVTEKFFEPLLVGSVPVYLGAPNINTYAPGEHCFINAADFESPQVLAKYLLALDADDASYNAFLEWRSKPLRSDFIRMLESVREPFLVRLYRRVKEIQVSRLGQSSVRASNSVPAQTAIPKILHQTWKDKNIPPHLVAYCESWKTHHPDWEYKLWTDIDNREFIRQNYGWFLPIYDGYPENIMRADAVRYFILYHYGGIYADLDAECLRPLDSILADRQLLLGLEPSLHTRSADAKRYGLENLIGNAIMASIPQHPFWEHVFKSLVGFHQAQSALVATGPCFLTLACQSYTHPEEISIAPHELLNPMTNEKPWSELPLELRTRITQTAYTIHHWMSSWFKPEAQESQQAPLSLLVHGQVINKMVMSVDQYRALLATCTNLPKISCMMLTKNRTEMAKRGIHCFRQQTYSNRELVIVDDSPDDSLEQFVKQLGDPQINYIHLPSENRTLGELRNQAATSTTGSYIAQWDDDDLSDPLRLEVQMAIIHALQTDACLLERHQILWLASRRLAMSTRRIWESSFLCAKAKLPNYPALRRGEDTPVIEKMVEQGRVGLLDLPLLYTYIFHGENTVDAELREQHWLAATESFEGPLFDVAFEQLKQRLHIDQW